MIPYAIWHTQYSTTEIHNISYSFSPFNPVLDNHLLIKESHDSKNLCKIILPEENFQNYKMKEVLILD